MYRCLQINNERWIDDDLVVLSHVALFVQDLFLQNSLIAKMLVFVFFTLSLMYFVSHIDSPHLLIGVNFK